MVEVEMHRRLVRAATVALAVLLGPAASAGAAETKGKDKPWPTRAEPTQSATGCEYMGKGYVKAPDSETCIRMSGNVRSEMSVFGR